MSLNPYTKGTKFFLKIPLYSQLETTFFLLKILSNSLVFSSLNLPPTLKNFLLMLIIIGARFLVFLQTTFQRVLLVKPTILIFLISDKTFRQVKIFLIPA